MNYAHNVSDTITSDTKMFGWLQNDHTQVRWYTTVAVNSRLPQATVNGSYHVDEHYYQTELTLDAMLAI